MPKINPKLSQSQVRNLAEGTHFVGGVGGLTLQVGSYSPRLKRHTASWVLRIYVGSKKRHLGLGSFPELGLTEARNRALALKSQVSEGLDPTLQKSRQKEALDLARLNARTFKSCAEQFMLIHEGSYRSQKHALQWRSTLTSYAYPFFGNKQVQDITREDVLSALSQIWSSKTETAKRLQNRIEQVFDYAISCGYLEKHNPARWKGFLSLHLAAPSKIAKKRHFPALPYRDLPEFIKTLQNKSGISAQALHFLILTTVRTGTVRKAQWSEIDFELAEWRIPKEHTKTATEHRVPLTAEMISLLKSLPQHPGSDLLFPTRYGNPLSDMALTQLIRRMQSAGTVSQDFVPHGFRATFKIWASEQTSFPTEVSEIALMHTVGNSTYKAYQRSDLFGKRRELMEQWSKFAQGL
jgi:integrase